MKFFDKKKAKKTNRIWLTVLTAFLISFTACAVAMDPIPDSEEGTQPEWSQLENIENENVQNESIEPQSSEAINERADAGDMHGTDSTSAADTDSTEQELQTLIASLEDYGDKEVYAKLYEMRAPCHSKFTESQWHRTNVHNGFSGTIDISDVSEQGFNSYGELFYYSHSGPWEEYAYLVTDTLAIAKYEDDYLTNVEPEYVAFLLTDDGMRVFATASSAFLDFGMNVSIDGEYTTGEPVYTNADILTQTYSEEDLAALAAIMPAEVYEEHFLFPTQYGVIVTDEKDADGNRTVEVFLPTMGGYSYTLTVSAGGTYTITFDNGEIYTNS